jgi:hypothetical protein
MRSRFVLPLLLSACTLGEVTWGGDPVAGAEVRFTNCAGHTWSTTTSTAGWFGFDGHASRADHIPAGMYLQTAILPAGYRRHEIVEIDYASCPAPYEDKLCSFHDVDFGWRPLSGWEFAAFDEALDLHNEVTYHTFHRELCLWL